MPDGQQTSQAASSERTAAPWQAALAALRETPTAAAAQRVADLAEQNGTPQAGFDALAEAVAAGGGNPVRHIGAGLARRSGAGELAEAYLRAILAADPADAAAHNELGLVYLDRGERATARAWLEAAEAVAPQWAAPAYNLGRLAAAAGDGDPVPPLRRALARDRQHIHAWFALIRCYEMRNDLDAARAALVEAEAAVGRPPKLAAAGARLAYRAGALDEARARLDALPWERLDGPAYRDTLFLAGAVYDRVGETDRALACCDAGNRRRAQSAEAQRHDKRTFLAEVEALRGAFTAQRVAAWPSPMDAPSGPVFLVGFPRSGTTLVETALAGHERLTVLQERPAVGEIVAGLQRHPAGFPEAVFAASEAELAELRRAYLAARDAYSQPAVTAIDKLPLNLRFAGVLYRLFPGARFVFCLRHPADAVLSCFMQHFVPNPAMNNFYSLADAAHAYDRVMDLWQHYRRLLPLTVATVPYESLVADFSGTMAGLLGFLGLDWDHGVARFADRAQAGESVRTPSYAQLAQGLYGHARYRWQRYRDSLAPQLPGLRAWAEALGYREAGDGTIAAPRFAVDGPGAAQQE